MAKYDDIIQAAAKQYNVDPALIRGVIATESTNNPKAVSDKGATGLMQIMPSNYKALGITDATDPQQNIFGGAKLLSQLLDSSPDVATALRRYQGGEDQSKWGPVNAAYPGKVLSAAGIGAQQAPAASATLPGIPTSQPAGDQSDDAIFAQFSKGAAPPQGQQGPQSDDAIFASMTKAAPTAAPSAGAIPATQSANPAPAANQPGGAMSFLAGLGHGVQETVLGAQQLLGHGAQAVGLNNIGNWLVNDANQGLARGNAEYAPYQAAHPIAAGAGNIGGSIAATAPLAAIGPAVGGLGTAALRGGISGGLTSLAAPVDPNSQNYWADKAAQTATGVATGGVLGPAAYGVGRLISPNVSQDVQTLMSKGVTPTPGQILGGGFARTEEKLTSVPVLGDMIKNAQQRAVQQFNTAAYNDALAPIGQRIPAGKVGQEGVEAVRNAISDTYDRVLPQMQFRVDPQFQTDITNLGNLAQNLPDAQANTFMKVLKTQIFGKMTPQGYMDGDTLKGVQSELARKANGYLSSSSFDDRELGAALSEIRSAVDDNLARVNAPNLAQDLANANAAWARFTRIRSAAASQGAANNEGVFTAAMLSRAARSGDQSVGKGATATGSALMQDLAGAGQRVLGSKYPDSGTVGRGLLGLLAPGGIAAGLATQPTATLATLGGIGLGSLPYTQLGQRAAASLLTSRPQFSQPIGNAISRLGAPVVAGSLPALLSGSR
jgi:hypothetical protein